MLGGVEGPRQSLERRVARDERGEERVQSDSSLAGFFGEALCLRIRPRGQPLLHDPTAVDVEAVRRIGGQRVQQRVHVLREDFGDLRPVVGVADIEVLVGRVIDFPLAGGREGNGLADRARLSLDGPFDPDRLRARPVGNRHPIARLAEIDGGGGNRCRELADLQAHIGSLPAGGKSPGQRALLLAGLCEEYGWLEGELGPASRRRGGIVR